MGGCGAAEGNSKPCKPFSPTQYFNVPFVFSGVPARKGRGAPRHQAREPAGTTCIKIGLPAKLILSKRKGLPEDLFS